MKPSEIYKKLLSEKGKEGDFTEYNKLSTYQKDRVYNVNYWRIQTGKEPMAVPEDAKKYWTMLEENLEACLE